MTKSFPPGFLWGTAGAAHQIEGNNLSSDAWAWEHMPGSPYREPSGDALDFYHRYSDDIRMLSDLGLNAFRLGIEWGRIEPEQGLFSNAEMDHYLRVIDTCLDNGLEPVVTLHHFTSPRWLIPRKGWKNPDTAKLFADHVHRVATALGDRVSWFCTINEANTPRELAFIGRLSGWEQAQADAAAYFGLDSPGDFVPFLPFASTDEAVAVVLDAHRRAVDALHAVRSQNRVGLSVSLQEIVADPGDEVYAAKAQEDMNLQFLRGDGAGHGDFVAVQNYTRMRFGPDGFIRDTGIVTDNNLALVPEALTATARLAQEVTGLPVLITEHGADLPTQRDAERVALIEESLDILADAIAEGLDVRGYLHWSFADNYEWFNGYSGHFGLYEFDRTTQARTPRPSATRFGQIARANAL